MFQGLLKTFNIPTIFFGFIHDENALKLTPYFKDNYFHVNEIMSNTNYFLKNDFGHFNQLRSESVV